MRTVHADFETHIAGRNLKLCEIYELEAANGTTYYFTTHTKNITWNSHTYNAVPIARSELTFKLDLSPDQVEIIAGNISGDLYQLCMNNALDLAKVTIKRIRWDDTAVYDSTKELTLFEGIVSVDFDASILTLTCLSLLSSLNIKIPRRVYQEQCNYRFCDAACGLSHSAHAAAGTVTSDGDQRTLIDTSLVNIKSVAFDNGDEDNPITAGDALNDVGETITATCMYIHYLTASTGTIYYYGESGGTFADDDVIHDADDNAVTVNGTPASADIWALGEVKFLTGNNAGFRRMVVRSDLSNHTLYMASAFPYDIDTGDTYTIYPGCDKKAATCQSRYDNEDKFSGYLYMPKIEETL